MVDDYVNIVYTPYNMPVVLNHNIYAKFNQLLITVNTKDEYSKILKESFYNCYKNNLGKYKLLKKLDTLFVVEFKIEEKGNNTFDILVETPIRRILFRYIDAFYKVVKVFLKIILQRLPKYVQAHYGEKKLEEIYSSLKIQVQLFGNYNIAKIYRLFRNCKPYKEFKYFSDE